MVALIVFLERMMNPEEWFCRSNEVRLRLVWQRRVPPGSMSPETKREREKSMRKVTLLVCVMALSVLSFGHAVDAKGKGKKAPKPKPGAPAVRPGDRAPKPVAPAAGAGNRKKNGTWLIVTLADDILLKQAGWGAIAHHRSGKFNVTVDEKLKGTGPIKNGDVIHVSLMLHGRHISADVSGGKSGQKFLLGLEASDHSKLKVGISHHNSNTFCRLDDKLKALLNKEKNLPVGWSYGKDGKLQSFWMSCKDTPEAKYFDKSNVGIECPETGMPAYTVGQADVVLEFIDAGFDYYDFKGLKERAVKSLLKRDANFGLDKHVVKITVKNNHEKKIEVPVLRRIGDKILWNNSAVVMIEGKGGKVFHGREKIGKKTEAVTLDPGKSVSGQVDIYLADGFPGVLMYGWGGTRCTGVVALGDVAKGFVLDCDPLRVWGTYSRNAPGVAAPVCTTKGPIADLHGAFMNSRYIE